MTAKRWFISIPSMAMLILAGWLAYVAAQSPLVVGAFRVALIALALALVALAYFGLLFAGAWAYKQVRQWVIEIDTAEGKTVQFHSHQGQTFAVNPKGYPIQQLTTDTRTFILPSEDDPDESRFMRWLASRRSQRVIDGELTAPEPMLELPAPPIPVVVRLEDIFDPDQASIRRLILGAGPGGQVVTGHLKDLSHIGIGGTSRWGKSTFLQSILYQLMMSPEPIDFYLSDVGGTAFISFNLPYADSIATSERLVARVYDLFQDRHSKFTQTGRRAGYGIRSLDIYNRLTGESMPYVVLAIDEATALMSGSKVMAQQISELILQAGKYGIWLLLSGQNWKGQNIDTTIRDQFSSRFQFKAMDRHQASILIPGSGAQEFTDKGRAAIILPGAVSVQTIQTPLIDEATIATAQRPQRPADLQWIVADEPEANDDPDRAAKIRELYAAGMSKTEIAQYFGYKTNSGAIFYEIKAALEDDE